jgi:hypothetical protein
MMDEYVVAKSVAAARETRVSSPSTQRCHVCCCREGNKVAPWSFQRPRTPQKFIFCLKFGNVMDVLAKLARVRCTAHRVPQSGWGPWARCGTPSALHAPLLTAGSSTMHGTGNLMQKHKRFWMRQDSGFPRMLARAAAHDGPLTGLPRR